MKRQLLSEFGIFSYMFNTFPLNNRPRKVTLPKILIREGLFLLEGSLMTTITITTAAMSATFPSGDTKLLPSISLRFLHFSFLLITSSASSSFFSLLLLFVLNLLLLLRFFFSKCLFFMFFLSYITFHLLVPPPPPSAVDLITWHLIPSIRRKYAVYWHSTTLGMLGSEGE